MQRYFMHLSYRGAPFHGWQSQPNAISIQSTIENALSMIMRTPIKITGAGRTDTGVNARSMICHFDTIEPIENTERLIHNLNSLIGKDIAIYSITPVHEDAHARFDATSRTYHYYIHTRKSPFDYALSWQAPENLNFELMNKAAKLLLEVSDFSSFAKLHSDAKTNICKVDKAEWIQCDKYKWVFIIRADRFLRNMVRAVVGTLVDVGRKKISLSDFQDIISAKNRCAAGTSMPPQGLFLWDVTYPYYKIEDSDII